MRCRENEFWADRERFSGLTGSSETVSTTARKQEVQHPLLVHVRRVTEQDINTFLYINIDGKP